MALTKVSVSTKIVAAIVAAIVGAAAVYGIVIDPEAGKAAVCLVVNCV